MLRAAMLVAAAAACTALSDSAAAFAAYKAAFKKAYVAEEEAARFAAYRASVARLREEANPAHGLTKFSDLTPDEFRARYLKRKAPGSAASAPAWDGKCTACTRFPEYANYTAASFDWSTKGAVTVIKDQGNCGSCWAFSATGDVEGTWFLAGWPLTPLSEQELVDCVYSPGTDTCDAGGQMEDAFPWIAKKGGIVAESTYPYTSGQGSGFKPGKSGKCKTAKERPVVAQVASWFQVSKTAKGEADILKQLAQVGPISIGINAAPMQDYSNGVDDPKRCKSSAGALDHGVLVVGYGTDNGVDYWKIKNSWADDWGENGYYRVVRGVNKCGLAMDATHSVAGGPPAPPAPPATPAPPPTPSPPSSAAVTVKACASAQCGSGCKTHTYSVGQCSKLPGGDGSILFAYCGSAGVQSTWYGMDGSGRCKGSGDKADVTANMCHADPGVYGNDYYEYACQ